MSKQIINVGSGELVGDGEGLRSAFIKINGNFDEVYADIAAVPTDLSGFNNDVGYITTASIPTDISAFNNDVGYITTDIFTGTNVSLFVNDAGYITANIFTNTNVGDLINNVGYLTIDTLPPATNLGNLVITGTNLQTIAGTIGDADIELLPGGVGTVRVPSLTLPVGSLVEEVDPTEVPIADLILDTIVDYSTGTGDTLTIGTIGNPTGIAHPWAIYRFTTTPDPVLAKNDVIGGSAVPVNSVISYVGTGSYSAYVVTDKVFPLGVPVDGITITTVRPTINASLSITTAVDTDISLKTGGGLGAIVTHGDIIPFNNNEYSLGTPTKRFKQLWLGGGTIFIADDTLGIDLSIAAINGDLVVQGGAGLEVGEFRFRDNQLFLTNPNREIVIGTTGATAPVTFKRTIQVRNITDTYNLLDVDQQGRITVLSDIATDPTQAAMSIVGARARDVKSPNNLGVLLQLTGSSTAPSRIYHDSYGAANYSAFIGRHARGSSTTSTQTLANDIISRIGANPHDDTGFASISTMRMDFVNAEDQTTSARGSKIEFWTTPIGSTVIGKRVTIDGSDIVLTSGGSGGVVFQDATRQTTAWTGTVQLSQVQGLANGAVTQINVGVGLTQTTSTGIVGIDATGVQTTVGTTNQVIVTDSGGKNLTLSLPQNINTTASVTFENITVNNINVLGTSTVAYNLTLEGKILYLASSATDISQIDGGGIQLGTGTFARSILYSNGADDYWYTDPGTGFQTEHFNATTGTFIELYATDKVRFGTAYADYDFSNAILQGDGNVNSYLQNVIKNHSSGTNASADFVAVNDIGDDENYYIDVGINSSNYSNPAYSIMGPNSGYLYIAGGNLTVGTASTGSNILFHTGGTTNDKLRATITDAGLSLVGTLNGLTLPSTSTTAGYVLSNNGTGTLTWVQPQTGYIGSRGATGFTGSQGIQGIQGVIGYTGSRGTDGVIGYNGSTGFTGSSGIGYAGSQGPQGTTGFTGSTGTQGVIGFTGSKGDTGAIGNTGLTGFTGSTGTQGVIGFTGSKGDTGAQGNIGPIGYTGSLGSIGFTGSAGAGFTGSAGIGFTGSASTASGFTGSVGFTGSKGDQGSPGYTGSASNVAGYTGSQGSAGGTGFTGSAGAGFTGSKGDQGSPGYTGSIGYSGSAGVNGVTSITGGNNIVLSTSTGAVSITRIDGLQTVVTGNSTSTYTILSTDQYFGSTRSTVGACTVTLPLGSGVTVGRQYVIKDEGGNSGQGGRRITVTASGSDTIDGSATRTITSNYGSLTVMWTGTRWSVI